MNTWKISNNCIIIILNHQRNSYKIFINEYIEEIKIYSIENYYWIGNTHIFCYEKYII